MRGGFSESEIAGLLKESAMNSRRRRRTAKDKDGVQRPQRHNGMSGRLENSQKYVQRQLRGWKTHERINLSGGIT